MSERVFRGQTYRYPTPNEGPVIGECYVFMRDRHAWHCCEVAVIAVKGTRYTVVRATDVCKALLAKPDSPKRKLATRTCSARELW